MYGRTEYEMSDSDLQILLDACRPVPAIMVGGHLPLSPQENANRAWAKLGEKMGFDSMTVQPAPGKGQRFFTAVPTETEEARAEREARELEEKRQAKIQELLNTIESCRAELVRLGHES